MGGRNVEIETHRLLLRPIVADDAAVLAEVYAHPDVARYLRPLDADATARQVDRFVDEWGQLGLGIFSIFLKEGGEFIGRSGLHYWPQLDEVEVGWVLRRDVWGAGYATEAGAASMTWGFRERGLQQITAIIANENKDSLAVAARLKMSVLRHDQIFGLPVTVFSRNRVLE